jgi:predicted phosphoribosyltransferase
MFTDSYDAAMQLTKQLEKFRQKKDCVIAVPRSGFFIGYSVARALGLPLEVILSKKIGHPYNQELGIGSVFLTGTFIDSGWSDVSMDYIYKESDRILKGLQSTFRFYAGNRKPADLKSKTVILVDGGISAGNNILITIEALRKCEPLKIVFAVPVSSPASITEVSCLADEFICLHAPDDFLNISQYYGTYDHVSEDEVAQMMQSLVQLRNVA